MRRESTWATILLNEREEMPTKDYEVLGPRNEKQIFRAYVWKSREEVKSSEQWLTWEVASEIRAGMSIAFTVGGDGW